MSEVRFFGDGGGRGEFTYVDAVDETGVEVYEEDGGVEDGDFEGHGEVVGYKLDPILSSGMDLRSRFDAFIAGLETEALGSLAEDVFCVRLRQCEEEEDESEAAEYQSLVHAPSPIRKGDGKSTENGT